VTYGATVTAFTGVPGQRDHSHGVRDWWSMDWVWSALHLDDGTALHGGDRAWLEWNRNQPPAVSR